MSSLKIMLTFPEQLYKFTCAVGSSAVFRLTPPTAINTLFGDQLEQVIVNCGSRTKASVQ